MVPSLANGSRPAYLPGARTYCKGIYQESIAVLAPGCLERLSMEVGRQIEEWAKPEPKVVAKNDNRNVQFEVWYRPPEAIDDPLRPHLLVELTYAPPRLPTVLPLFLVFTLVGFGVSLLFSALAPAEVSFTFLAEMLLPNPRRAEETPPSLAS